MSQLLVRELDPATLAELKSIAARHKRSLEAEVRLILDDVAARSKRGANLVEEARALRAELAGRTFSDSATLVREGRDER